MSAPTGTFECPICGRDFPHGHSAEEQKIRWHEQFRPQFEEWVFEGIRRTDPTYYTYESRGIKVDGCNSHLAYRAGEARMAGGWGELSREHDGYARPWLQSLWGNYKFAVRQAIHSNEFAAPVEQEAAPEIGLREALADIRDQASRGNYEDIYSMAVDALAAPVEQEAAQVVAKADDFGQKVTALIGEIRNATSLAWRDSKVEELIELIDPQPPEQSAASGSREGRDAQDESSGEGCATATNTNQPDGAKLDCPKCRANRMAEPCGNPSDCGMIGTAFLGAANTNKGGDREL